MNTGLNFYNGYILISNGGVMIINSSVINEDCYCVNDDEFKLFDEYLALIKNFLSIINGRYSVFGEFMMYPENIKERSNYNINLDLSVCRNHVDCGIEFITSNSVTFDMYNSWSIALAKEPVLLIELYSPNTCYVEGNTTNQELLKGAQNLLNELIEKYKETITDNDSLIDIEKMSICTKLLDKVIKINPPNAEFMVDIYYNYTVDLRVFSPKKSEERTFRMKGDNSHILKNFERMLKGCL